MNKKELFCFVTRDGKYVALDSASGGYPYETDYPLHIYVWHSKELAVEYYEKFKRDHDWILKEFKGLDLIDVEFKSKKDLKEENMCLKSRVERLEQFLEYICNNTMAPMVHSKKELVPLVKELRVRAHKILWDAKKNG